MISGRSAAHELSVIFRNLIQVATKESAMCGRFTLYDSTEVLSKEFGAPIRLDLAPRYNIAPSQEVAVVRSRPDGEREFALLRWGLIPSWAKDPSIGARMINARVETAPEKPAFRNAFRHRRCLVPMSGFYEWRKEGKAKHPYHVSLREKNVMAIAGLWDRWAGAEDAPIESCTLLTTDANDVIAPLHERMPVIVAPENYELWLNPSGQDPAALRALLAPYPPDKMIARPVSRRVNDPSVDNASLLELLAG
jgi:putative SOS response-associated peptidase YedK